MDNPLLNLIKKIIPTRNRQGFGYMDAMIATVLIGIIGTELTPMLPQLIKTTQMLNTHIQLIQASDYVINYINRWTNLPIENKSLPINFYSVDDEIDPSGTLSINSLLFAEQLNLPEFVDARTMPNTYKVHMVVSEESINPVPPNSNYIIIKVQVWYDEDDDDIKQPSEIGINFRISATEKMEPE